MQGCDQHPDHAPWSLLQGRPPCSTWVLSGQSQRHTVRQRFPAPKTENQTSSPGEIHLSPFTSGLGTFSAVPQRDMVALRQARPAVPTSDLRPRCLSRSPSFTSPTRDWAIQASGTFCGTGRAQSSARLGVLESQGHTATFARQEMTDQCLLNTAAHGLLSLAAHRSHGHSLVCVPEFRPAPAETPQTPARQPPIHGPPQSAARSVCWRGMKAAQPSIFPLPPPPGATWSALPPGCFQTRGGGAHL